jgi:hypothetical protein
MASTPVPTGVPNDVVEWVRDAFRGCNVRVSEKLTNVPNRQEESLDQTWIEHFSRLASPVTVSPSWTVKVETHYLGGLRHYGSWEIADIGVLLFIKRGGRVTTSKVALLQSKRLYPTSSQVREEHIIDYRTGFARIADPEDLRMSIAIQAEYEFDEDCRYDALKTGSDQVRSISEYERDYSLLVYYQFYNPWSLPFVQRIPLSEYVRPPGELTHGVTILSASRVHELLVGKKSGYRPTVKELGKISEDAFPCGWPLEHFASDHFLLCREGTPCETVNDQTIRNLFCRRSGPIAAAIAITVEEDADQEVA